MFETIIGGSGAVNFVAVLAGATAAFALGYLWYAPYLFGRRWAEAFGVSLTQVPPASAMIAQFFGQLMLSLVVGILVGFGAWVAALLPGVTCALMLYAVGAFAGHRTVGCLVNAGYVMAATLIMLGAQIVLAA